MANRFGVKRNYGETPKRFGELWRNSETFWRIKAKRFGVKGSYGEFKKHVPLYVKNTLARARREQTKR